MKKEYSFEELMNNIDYNISFMDGIYLVRTIEVMQDEKLKEDYFIDLINKLEGVKYSLGYYTLPEQRKVDINSISYVACQAILGCNHYLVEGFELISSKFVNKKLLIENINKNYTKEEKELVINYALRFTYFCNKNSLPELIRILPANSKILTK